MIHDPLLTRALRVLTNRYYVSLKAHGSGSASGGASPSDPEGSDRPTHVLAQGPYGVLRGPEGSDAEDSDGFVGNNRGNGEYALSSSQN